MWDGGRRSSNTRRWAFVELLVLGTALLLLPEHFDHALAFLPYLLLLACPLLHLLHGRHHGEKHVAGGSAREPARRAPWDTRAQPGPVGPRSPADRKEVI